MRVGFSFLVLLESLPKPFKITPDFKGYRSTDSLCWRDLAPSDGEEPPAPRLQRGSVTKALLTSEGPSGALLCRVILLLTNSFDLEDGFLTPSNLEQVKSYLASAFPSKYSEVLPQIKNCSLQSELATVRRGRGLGLLRSAESRPQGPLRASHNKAQAKEDS